MEKELKPGRPRGSKTFEPVNLATQGFWNLDWYGEWGQVNSSNKYYKLLILMDDRRYKSVGSVHAFTGGFKE